jgi:DNA polymerase-3 subunit alpha
VGGSATQGILAERKANGPYKSFADFALRSDGKTNNRRVYENLILCGAFDSLGIDRLHLVQAIDRIIRAKSKLKDQGNALQEDFFVNSGLMPANPLESLIEVGPRTLPKEERLRYEKELLGFYLSGHPLDALFGLEKSIDSLPCDDARLRNGQQFVLVGCVGDITKKITKTGNRLWAHVQLSSRRGDLQINIFPESYERYGQLLIQGKILVVVGSVRIQDDRRDLNGIELHGIDDYVQRLGRRELRLTLSGEDKKLLASAMEPIADYLSKNRGPMRFTVEVATGLETFELRPRADLRGMINLQDLAQIAQHQAFRKLSLA